jgi:drug/metabolite transporter (DMT)-like permease
MIVKLVANEANLPTTELTTARAAVQLVVAVVRLLQEGAPVIPPKRARKWVWLRGILGAIGFVLFFHTVTCLPLGDAVAITSLYPITASLFARVFLKERIFWGQGAALLLSIAGIVFLCQPGFIFGSTSAIATVEIASASLRSRTIGLICGGVASILIGALYPIVRVANRGGAMNPLHFMFSFAIMSIVFSLVLTLSVPGQHFRTPPNARIWALMLGQGFLCAIGQYGLLLAAKGLPSVIASMLQVSDIFWGYLLQVIVFNEVPTLVTGSGASLIVLSILMAVAWKPPSPDSRALLSKDPSGAGGNENAERVVASMEDGIAHIAASKQASAVI